MVHWVKVVNFRFRNRFRFRVNRPVCKARGPDGLVPVEKPGQRNESFTVPDRSPSCTFNVLYTHTRTQNTELH